MLTGLSTYLFLEEKLTLERLQSIQAAGFDRTEIFALKPHFDYSDTALKKSLAGWFLDKEPFLHSIHTPFSRHYQALRNGEGLSLAHTEKVHRLAAVDEIKKCLECFENLSVPYAIVHMGAPGDLFSLRHLDAIYDSLESLIPFARSRGVTLLLENIPNELSLLDRMCRFLEESRLEEVGICLDLGHSFLQAMVTDEIRIGGALLRSTHLHDNHGKKDDHLFLFEGEIRWKEILKTFSDVKYPGCFMLELRSRGEDPLAELLQALKSADRLKQLEEEIIAEKIKGD